MMLALCEAPTHETRPDHNTGNDVPYSLNNKAVLGISRKHCITNISSKTVEKLNEFESKFVSYGIQVLY